ncbi:hypothetical protein Afil01_22960 [Actinorhabdospora filicis]|uniref:Bacteriocin biosynthesis cyclodehydratase domain-containing protein n=1 Tax=Actinorhabdospora filicis TaxID=1785913 RepID=A0A9W6SI12_9ACTN|nr:TOMM precursor leader peptide-binding protein [Actinorhabdospora filicis]GLZ77489.1 hypothetical protein Afil01_22960 [Actinorhabdospora filicis]
MAEPVTALPHSRLRLRDTAVVDDRDGEVAVYLHDLGGGSVLRGVPALMFRSVQRRFGPEWFTVTAAVGDDLAGDTQMWTNVLTALTERGILVTGGDERGTVPAPELLRVQVTADAEDIERLAGLTAAATNVELVSGPPHGTHPTADLAVLFDRGAGAEDALAFARRQAEAGRQSLTVRVYGENLELGPWTVPGRTPCFECYWSRLQAGRERTPPQSFLHGYALPATPSMAAEAALVFVAGEIAKAAAGKPPVTMGQVLRLELAALELVKHKVVSAPRCPTCATAFRAAA